MYVSARTLVASDQNIVQGSTHRKEGFIRLYAQTTEEGRLTGLSTRAFVQVLALALQLIFASLAVLVLPPPGNTATAIQRIPAQELYN